MGMCYKALDNLHVSTPLRFKSFVLQRSALFQFSAATPDFQSGSSKSVRSSIALSRLTLEMPLTCLLASLVKAKQAVVFQLPYILRDFHCMHHAYRFMQRVSFLSTFTLLFPKYWMKSVLPRKMELPVNSPSSLLAMCRLPT